MELNTVVLGDALEVAKGLPSDSVDCIVTSPPYYGLRDYGVEGQVGLESTPQLYIERLVDLFTELKRALKPSGTCWINLGDIYLDKSLAMLPARLAIGLQDRGWILRSEIIWHKPIPLPESVVDRPTLAHEKLYLLSQCHHYWYEKKAVGTSLKEDSLKRWQRGNSDTHRYVLGAPGQNRQSLHDPRLLDSSRTMRSSIVNLRDVWTISYEPSGHSHYAAFPSEIPRRCILLGCPPDGLVYDPFMGSGTTGLVAKALGRQWAGSELNPEYQAMALARINDPQNAERLYARWQERGEFEAGQAKYIGEYVQKGLFDAE